MFNPPPVTPGLLFFSFLYRSDIITQNQLTKRFEDLFGLGIEFYPTFNPLISYYTKEMGEESTLRRFFLVTKTPHPRESLLMSKLLALDWERELSQGGKRFVNVDTGLLTPENFLLATTKNYAHRIFIGQGIFVDLTYQCVGKKFEFLPWTYPDYRDQEKCDFFNALRLQLINKIKTNA